MLGESIVQNKVGLFEEQGDCYRSEVLITYKALSASLSEVENKGFCLEERETFRGIVQA
jgi:hypothetical protein